MKRTIISLIFCIVGIAGLYARTYDVSDVPNVHVADSTQFVSNPDGILSRDAVDRLNAMLRNIRRTTSAEAVVVVVDDIEGGDIDTFATELFEAWHLGKADKDNGLLILVAKDMRRAAIRPGYGLEGVLPDITCGQVLRQQVFPRFREGDYDGGVINAVGTIRDIVNDPANRDEIMSQHADSDYTDEEDDIDIFSVWLILSSIVTAAMLIVLFVSLGQVSGKTPRDKYLQLERLKAGYLAMTVFGMGIPLVASLPLVILLRRWRNATHHCPRCGNPMHKIDEVHDNEYLDRGQDLEERLGSVDYDVWLCDACGETDIEQYVTRNSPFVKCDRCGAHTAQKYRTRILRRATSTRKGEGVDDYKCLNCGNIQTKRFEIPVDATAAVAAGSAIGSSMFGGGGGGFGGGGFGGGHTGGGGASGGW